MERIHSILTSNELSNIADKDSIMESSLEVLCLGTGKGATTLMTGEPSSSFVILRDRKPLLLVDLGFGVVQSYKKHVDKDVHFENVYITHNHGDHAAELPVILAVVCGKRKPPMLYAAPEVMHRLCTLRLPEVTSANELEQLVRRKICEPGNCRTEINSDGRYHISVLPSQHSETCYGFIIYQDGEPVLGYTGDSGFSQSLYDELLKAPNVILDARMVSTYEHAGFSDVIDYFEDKELTGRQIFITGYGVEAEYPVDGIEGMVQLRTGERYSLLPASNILSMTNTKAIRTNITDEYMMPKDI